MSQLVPLLIDRLFRVFRTYRTELFVLLLFIGLACIYWFPLPLHLLSGQVQDDPIVDSAFNQWIIAWGSHALTHYPWRFFDSNMFYPFRYTLAWGDNLFGITIFAVPLIPLFGLIGAYNILFLLATALSGFTAYLLVRHITKQQLVAIIGGVMWGLTAVRVREYDHIQILAMQWVPLVFLFAERIRTNYRFREFLFFAGSIFLVLATNIYISIFTIISFGIYLFCLIVAGQISLRTFRRLAAGWLIASFLALPLYLPSIIIQSRTPLVWTLAEILTTPLSSLLPWPWPGQAIRFVVHLLGFNQPIPSRNVFNLGLLTYLFVMIGCYRLWLSRKEWRNNAPALSFLLIGIFAAVAATGPVITWYGQVITRSNPIFLLLHHLVLGFKVLRYHFRFLFFSLLGLVVFGCWGVTPFFNKLTSRLQLLLTVICIVWIVFEQAPAPIPISHGYSLADYPSDQWLAKQPDEFPILELPIVPSSQGYLPADIMEARRMFLSTYHWKRRVSGSISPYRHPYYAQHAEILNAIGDNPTAIKLLQEWKVKYVLYYPNDVISLGWGQSVATALQHRLDAIPQLKKVESFPEATIYEVKD